MSSSTVLRIKNSPYGFFENELYGYFKQFGKVEKVRVLRSKKGHSTGIVFVQFADADVAKIACDTMHNYILMENRLRCELADPDRLPACLRSDGLFVPFKRPQEARLEHARQHFATKTPAQERRQTSDMIKGLKKRMATIKELGIDYDYDFFAKFAEFKRAKADKEANKKKEEKEEEEKEEEEEEEAAAAET